MVERGDHYEVNVFKLVFSSISNSSTITTVKLQYSSKYIYWSASVELWFTCRKYDDHLIKNTKNITKVDKVNWNKIDV